MNKKNTESFGSPQSAARGGEYTVIKHDLIRVVVLNIFYLLVLLGLFYLNNKNNAVDSWFARVLRF